MTNLTEILRRAVRDCDCSYSQLERDTGITRQNLIRFVKTKQTLRLTTAEILMDYFGVSVTAAEDRSS